MAAPVRRARRMLRPATVEHDTSLRRRATSLVELAETSPYRRATATTSEDEEPEKFGPYLVYEKLGEGGMACVHRAERVGEEGFVKQIALKRLHTEASEDPGLVAGFVHEAQLASRLHHENIAQAYELGKIDDTYYIAMELVPGPTLSQVMAQTNNGAGAVPLPIAVELLIQLCDALDHAHDLRDEAGQPLHLIHRDVSPANIIISRSGAAKLIDFGIAKVRSSRHKTQAGIIKGKHGYIAPEYTFGQLDHRVDLFGLGVVAHELLTGRRLFLAENELDTIRNVRTMPIPPPSRFAVNVPPELDAIVMKALERDPDQRWQTAAAMRHALVDVARKQRVVISGAQIRDWVEWAFHQSARRESSVDRMLQGCEPSISIEMSEVEDARPLTPEPVRPPTPAPVRAPTPRPHTPQPVALLPVAGVVDEDAPTIDQPVPLLRRLATSPVIELVVRKPTPPSIVVEPTLNIAKRASTPALFRPDDSPRVAPRPGTVPFLAKPTPAAGSPRVRRAPAWRAPTRWVAPQKRRSLVPMAILLALVAFAVLAVDQGLIDLDRWRQLLNM